MRWTVRPRELTLRGFRSYAEETKFEWAGRNLVGVVGPTGSGKSSILDAISFALYGKTPRIERDTKSLINQRRDALHVSLMFDVEHETYRAVRTLRRNGSPAHTLYRIVDGVETELADRSREMTDRIELLLGLDFAAFGRSVLLAQNQFSRFLEATKADRNEVLQGVFGFDRLDAMRTVAKGRLDALGNRLAVLADRRATAEADRAALKDKTAELKAAEERAATLEQLRAPFLEMNERIAAAATRAAEEADQLERLGRLEERIPAPDRTKTLFESVVSAEEGVAAASEALAVATTEKDSAAERAAAVLAPIGGKAGLTDVGDAVASWKAARDRVAAGERATSEAADRVVAERQRVADVSARLAQAEDGARVAAGGEAAAAETLEMARVTLQRFHQDHRAHSLRQDLVVGEPCPVCEQQVATLPAGAAPESLEQAERSSVAAKEESDAASTAARAASEEVARLRAEENAAEEAVVGAESAIATVRHQHDEEASGFDKVGRAVEERLGVGDPEALLEAIRLSSAEAEEALELATVTQETSRQQLEQSQVEATASAAALGALREDLATLAGLLESDGDVGDDPVALGQTLERLNGQWKDRHTATESAVGAAREEESTARAALADLLEAAGIGASDDVVQVIAAALTERTAREAEANMIEKRLADLEQLGDDETELVASSELLRTVHADLARTGFLGFVLDERRRVLGDLASEHLEILTAGRYRFDDSGEFLVVDLTAADAIRSPASLSGGETFLASLALALSLAEIVAREGGRLDAFFLDEGFGSLDPEHLDLAMDGIERLITTGQQRLVVVVSHVPALRERIEDLVVLDRDPITGDSIVVSGAAAP